MPKAEILTIGTELLLGEIVDTNTQALARILREAGVDLYWTGTVGDNEARIAAAVQHALTRCDVLLCTGGLGPTVDDVTREGIAEALGVEMEFREELWAMLQERFARFKRKPTENNKRQAYLPAGAQALENAVGTAPGFLIEHGGQVIISMPGVPGEMHYIMEYGVLPYFEQRYGKGAVIRTRILHTAGVPESQIDEKLDDLERQANPTVGLAAHAGAVDVRLTAKADSADEAEQMLAEVEAQARERLGDWVYGANGEPLARVVLGLLAAADKRLAVIEKGLDGAIIRSLTGQGNAFVGGEIQGAQMASKPLPELTDQYAKEVRAEVVLGVELGNGDGASHLRISLRGLGRPRDLKFSYGGHIAQAPLWATNLALSLLRSQLLKSGTALEDPDES
ncbi:MAG: hypothetical protein KIS85_04650 [Anaerolineales bacterium]|nr:hypothetical protein [Anaerolineales bacterium]